MKTDIYQLVTDRILALLESGTVPWQSPCLAPGGLPRNHSTGKTYRGINVFLLGGLRFTTPGFMTFIQAREMGGHVRKGEKGFLVVKYGTYTKTGADSQEQTGEEAGPDPETRGFLKGYTVFHTSQIDGIEFPPSVVPPELSLTERTAQARGIVENMPHPPEIRHGGSMPSYWPSVDCVRMPEPGWFHGEEAYFSTLFHELAHSTGAINRLARKSLLENKGFLADGDTARKVYAEEELVAEMTAGFLNGHAGILESQISNSAAYLEGWVKALKSKDARGWIIRAASQAQRASDYILNVPPVGGMPAAPAGIDQ